MQPCSVRINFLADRWNRSKFGYFKFGKEFCIMATRRQSRRYRSRWQQWGFTLPEMLVIVIVMGVLVAFTAPSLAAFFDAMKVNQVVTELRTIFQDSQRQAIRTTSICTVGVQQVSASSGAGSNPSSNAKGHEWNTVFVADCATDSKAPPEVRVISNLKPQSKNDNEVEVKFSPVGSAEFAVQTSVSSANTPADPSAKMVAYAPNREGAQKCIVVSSSLGLARVGDYKGSIDDPKAITDQGICTAMDWRKQ